MTPTAPSSAHPTTSTGRRQDLSIQSLRGIAVILMVAGHVIGATADHGLLVGDHSLWRYCYQALADIRMPLFTLISGYVYAMVPVTRWQHYPQLVKGKSRRLLLPLITVGALYYVLERAIPGTNSDTSDMPFWRVYVFGFEHLWFLQSIFLIFLVVGILDSCGVLASRAHWAAITAVSGVVFIVVHVPTTVDVFTISGALRLLPFFLLGYGLRRHPLLELRGVPAVAAIVAFAGVFAIRLITILGLYHPDGYADRAIAISVGIMGVVLIYSARNALEARWLAWIGGFSFGIYLLHVLANAAARELLEQMGLHRVWALFAFGLLIGIVGPIAFQRLFRHVSFVQTFVLGERRSIGQHKPRRHSGVQAFLSRALAAFRQRIENRSRTRRLVGSPVEPPCPETGPG